MASATVLLKTLTRRPRVAVVGNPNAGKTTLFNALTGGRQKVANYPGVTVERVSGPLRLGDTLAECVDIPGLYSLTPVSEDERVAVEALRASGDDRPDLFVCVLDATNLERNLFLFSQLAQEGRPVVVALTMVDRLPRRQAEVSVRSLRDELGVDVVPVIGHREEGVEDLKAAIAQNLGTPKIPPPDLGTSAALVREIEALQDRLHRAGVDAGFAEVRQTLLRPTDGMAGYVADFPEVRDAVAHARERLAEEDVLRPSSDTQARYAWASEVQRRVTRSTGGPVRRSRTEWVDAFLTHRLFGLLFFVGVMYGIFQSIYTFATPLMDLVDAGFGWIKETVGRTIPNEDLRALVVDGLVNGVGSAVIFLPQILILFFFIAFLEGTGYLARAAFLMDKLLGWCGLNGRAFIPLLSSFACAIPGIMAARVMPDPKSRLATILVAPLMSCSARLPVYVLLIGAFIEPRFGPGWAGFALFAMHFVGLFVAIPVVLALNRGVLKGRRLPFVLELPPYQWPKGRDVLVTMTSRARTFLKTAGTIIVVMSVVIWALSYYPRDTGLEARVQAAQPGLAQEDLDRRVAEKRLEESYLGRFGKAIEPAFLPAGFDWRISTAILSAFPAREVVVSSMGVIFNQGADQDEESVDLRGAVQEARWPDGRPLFTLWTSVGLMVFFALCAQCMATLAAVRRETNSWRWPVFMFVYMTALAYGAAVLIHQLGRSFGSG